MLLRTHWLLWDLNDFPEFKNAYMKDYNYLTHNYIFYRLKDKYIYDCFIVVRTSKHCFRVMYYNKRLPSFEYFSCRRSINVVRRMNLLYLIDKRDSSDNRCQR